MMKKRRVRPDVFKQPYLDEVKGINEDFERLILKISRRGLTDTGFLLGVAYKSFTNDIEDEVCRR